MRRRRRFLFIGISISAILIYFLLVFLLLYFESSDPSSQIHTPGDAFWYSLVTLTTVGYGDITPVTTAGHVISVLFLLLSLGILAAVIGGFVSFLARAGIPMLSLRSDRKDNWYYFADLSLESDALAEQIHSSDPDGVIIFGENRENAQFQPDYPCLFLDISPAYLTRIKGKNSSRCNVFFMKENDIGVNPRAEDISSLPVEVYARTSSGEDNLSGNIHFFNSYECCAREYWRSRPLTAGENEIAIIGFGRYGRALLERAILANVIDPDQHVAYHIFGDGTRFLQIHNHLDTVFSLQEESPDKDALIFHNTPWTSHRDLLQKMDRIIICQDDEFVGWDIFWQLTKFYIIPGRIYLRSSRKVDNAAYFGDNDSVYTPEHVLKTSLNRAAMAMNDQYREKHPDRGRDWDHLDLCLQQSLISAADHIYIKVRILLQDDSILDLTPDILSRAAKVYESDIQDPDKLDWYRQLDHLRWLRFYCYYNWTYSEARNQAARQDPRVIPYKKMSPEYRWHSDYYWGLLGQIDKYLSDRS